MVTPQKLQRGQMFRSGKFTVIASMIIALGELKSSLGARGRSKAVADLNTLNYM